MNTPEVSVVIVTLNTRELLRRALDSLRNAARPPSLEIIVVDNGSDDGTPEMMRAEYPECGYHWSPVNLGFARANNLGAALATGRLLCLMNSDARVEADSLRRTVEHLDRSPGCGVAGVQLLNSDGSDQNSTAPEPSLAAELLGKSLWRSLRRRGAAGDVVEVDSVIGAFMVVRRDLWTGLGGLDERYFFYFEETDFCTRVRARGLRVDWLRQVRVWHEQGASASRVRPRARIEYWKSRYTYFRLHRGMRVASVLKTALLVRLLLTFPFNVLLAPLSAGVRRKLVEQAVILRWHLGGCDPKQGLAASS